jgi:hypothetical protein
MLVAVTGFGSIWTRRLGRDAGSMTRYTRDASFYNTTGVPVGDRFRARSRVYGVARFNGSSGFIPHNPARMLNRVFCCAEPCTRSNGNQVLFERLIEQPCTPDYYLVTIREEITGWVDRASPSWIAHGCFLISFSESDLNQEAMLLVPPFGWVRGTDGVYILEPDAHNASHARLVPGSA